MNFRPIDGYRYVSECGRFVIGQEFIAGEPTPAWYARTIEPRTELGTFKTRWLAIYACCERLGLNRAAA